MPSLNGVYWPKWGTYDFYLYDFFRRSWKIMNIAMPKEPFRYFSSVCHAPEEMGMFILGGSDEADNFSRNNLLFKKY